MHDITTSAVLSPCRTWRYRLDRRWAPGSAAMFVMLNPSTADETDDDPTIRRCMGFARSWGMGGLVVCNLFAFRATDPRQLAIAPDPIGPDNDDHITTAAQNLAGGIVVCAWGAHRAVERRARAVMEMLSDMHSLGITKDGHPRHPLYLRADTMPRPFPEERASQ